VSSGTRMDSCPRENQTRESRPLAGGFADAARGVGEHRWTAGCLYHRKKRRIEDKASAQRLCGTTVMMGESASHGDKEECRLN
jgi:hypothetical protein